MRELKFGRVKMTRPRQMELVLNLRFLTPGLLLAGRTAQDHSAVSLHVVGQDPCPGRRGA